MTTIGSVPSFLVAHHNAGSEKPAPGEELADHYDFPAPPDGLLELTERLDALEQKQLRMSNTQYLLARFALQEQISAERLKAGQDLDTIGIRFDGQIFELAGSILETVALEPARLPFAEMVHVAPPRDR